MKILYSFMFLLFLFTGTCSLRAQDTQGDSTRVVFHFLAENDTFYVPYQGNSEKLNQILKLVDTYKTDILSEKVPIYVTSYCSGLSTQAENLSSAKIRANRVKSELIYRGGLNEKCFITANRTSSYQGRKSVVVVSFTIPEKEVAVKEVVKVTPPKEEPKTEPKAEPVRKEEPPVMIVEEVITQKRNVFNIRTNLLYWAAAIPNLGIEYKPSESVGILLNGAWTHFSWSDKKKQWRVFNINPEVRYYMGGNKRFYLGVEGHYGDYNYKLGDTGRQADFIGGGLTTGYQLRLSNVFDMDFNLGLGYTRLSNYEKYTRVNGDYIRLTNPKGKNIWGPTQVGVTLIWKVK